MSDTVQDTQLTQSQTIVARKPRRSNKPPLVKAAVIAKAMLGTSNTQIAEDLDINRNTVRAILSESELQQHVKEVRSDLVLGGDLWKARKVMREKLEKGSESAATSILKGFNVLQTRPEVSVNVNLAQNWLVIKEAEQGE